MNAQLADVQLDYKFLAPKPSPHGTPTDDVLVLNDEINRLFDNSNTTGIIVVNEEGSILSFSSKAGEVFGYSANQAIGKNIGDLILLEYPDKLDSCIISFLKQNGGTKFLDKLCGASEKSEGGSLVPLKFSVGKTQFEDRLLITMTVQHLDRSKLQTQNEQFLIKKLTEVDQLLVKKTIELSEYKNLIRQESAKRKHLTDKLRLSQAMSSIDARFIKAGRLAEQIAHDFNSLLIPLKTYPTLLKNKLPEGSECREYCDTMEKIAHRLLQVNDQLLALMSFNRQNNIAFDVNMVLVEATNLVKDYFKNDFTIENAVPNNPYTIMGRPEELYRVFFNLLLNARDALKDEKGRITVKSEKVVLNGESKPAGTFFSNEYIKISIIDNGSGISKDNLNKIFDPFFTTKNASKHKSTGLGLTIVNDMVKDHNGFIKVDSSVGEGTTVAVHLPIKEV